VQPTYAQSGGPQPIQEVAPAVEIGLAYVMYLPEESYPKSGFFVGPGVSLAVDFSQHVALVGDVSYFVEYFGNAAAYSILGGPRVFERRILNLSLPRWLGGGTQTIGALAQVLVGANRVSDEPRGLAIQPGAGLLWASSGRPTVLYEVDYVLVRDVGRYRSGPRMWLGIIVWGF
jgi:hypothetical protein